jgi:hypothetical protein
VLITLAWLSACSWFGLRKPPKPPDPTEIIVTGAPAGSLVFVDGVQSGQAVAHDDQTQILDVAAGTHKVEIHMNDKVVYREDAYVGPGEHRFVIVASGFK